MPPSNEQFLIACALLRLRAITGEECLALTGASQKEIVSVINSHECRQHAIRIQTEGLAQEVVAQLDLFRAQLKLRERLYDPEIGTPALLAISQFLFSIGGMKERRQARVAEATGPKFSVVQIFDTDPPELVAQKRKQAAAGIAIYLPSNLPTNSND